MRRPAVEGLWLPIVISSLLGLGSSIAVAQGYTFAPGAPSTGAGQWGGHVSPSEDPSMMLGPGGRPYRFRENSAPEPEQGYSFRPDSGLGQMPKNWGNGSTWANDPLLQQGLIFRPLDRKAGESRRREPTATPTAPPVYPYPYGSTPSYPYYYGGDGEGSYPVPVDPYTGGWPPY